MATYPVNAPIQIPGAGDWWQELGGCRYDYDKDMARCPVCDDVGVPWGGWFHCYDCTAIAVVEDGRVFVRVKLPEVVQATP